MSKHIDLLLNLLNNHPNDWKEVLENKPYCLMIKQYEKDNDLWIFKYNQIETQWMQADEVRAARGLILSHKDNKWTPVCYAFDKFFNYQEGPADKLDFNSSIATEKIDGSLIRLYWWKGHLQWATNGMFDCDCELPGFLPFCEEKETADCKTFLDLVEYSVRKAFSFKYTYEECMEKLEKSMPEKYTILFELVSPRNKIVIGYKETKMYFLEARRMSDYEETFNPIGLTFLFATPKVYKFNTPADVVFKDDVTHEGVVLCDKDFNRVKVKTEFYVKAHRIKGEQQMSYPHLFDCVMTGDYDDLISVFPEYKKLIFTIKDNVSNFSYTLKILYDDMKNYWNSLKGEEKDRKKKYAEKVIENYSGLKKFLFFIPSGYSFDDAKKIYFSKLDYSWYKENYGEPNAN